MLKRLGDVPRRIRWHASARATSKTTCQTGLRGAVESLNPSLAAKVLKDPYVDVIVCCTVPYHTIIDVKSCPTLEELLS